MWKTYDLDNYIVRFFIQGGMIDFQLRNDDNFLNEIAKKVESNDKKIEYGNKDIFDIAKTILDINEDKTLTDFHEKYPNSKVQIKVHGDIKNVTLRLKQKAFSKSFRLDDTFYPMKLTCFIGKLI